MSLGKAKTRIKEGIGELQSVKGLQHMAMWFGIGVAIGVILDLIFEYMERQIVNALGMNDQVVQLNTGFSIYYANPARTGISWDDVGLIIINIALLFSKKFWMVIGFFVGWYMSSNTGLYAALGLPIPEGQQ